MKKLKLDLESLAVDSFDTRAEEQGERGTVQAHGIIIYGSYYCSPLCAGTYQAWCYYTGGPIYV